MADIEKIDVVSRIAKQNLELLAELEAARKDISTLLGIANENMHEADKLRAALTEIRDAGPMTLDDQRWRIALDALGGEG